MTINRFAWQYLGYVGGLSVYCIHMLHMHLEPRNIETLYTVYYTKWPNRSRTYFGFGLLLLHNAELGLELGKTFFFVSKLV